MTTITADLIQAIRAKCAGNAHAVESGGDEPFRLFNGDPDAPEYGSNPDLVAALDHQTADVWLKG